VKYMLLMQASGHVDAPPIHTWTPAEVTAHIQFMHDINAKLVAEGELVEAQGLAGPEDAKIVRATPTGAPEVTDGPFPESKEFLAGYWVVDVDNEARAIELAAAVSLAPGPGGVPLNLPIEVRQVMAAPTQDA
jgi:hypothetical protein